LMGESDDLHDARKSNSCSGFSDSEFQELTSIVESYIAASGLLMTLVELAGRVPQTVLNQLPAASPLSANNPTIIDRAAAYQDCHRDVVTTVLPLAMSYPGLAGGI